MKRIRLLKIIIKRSGVGKLLAGFAAAYFIGALVLLIVEPAITKYGDALWFLWAVSLTVGLGDVTATTFAGRMVTVFFSLYAIVTAAIMTAVVVDYFNEMRQSQYDASLATFLDKLEHLEDLDKDELRSISAKVRAHRR